MNTETTKKIALARHLFIEEFLKKLNKPIEEK